MKKRGNSGEIGPKSNGLEPNSTQMVPFRGPKTPAHTSRASGSFSSTPSKVSCPEKDSIWMAWRCHPST